MLYKVNDETYVRLAQVSAINFYPKQHNAFIRCDGGDYVCSIEEAEKLLATINGAAAPAPVAPKPQTTSVKIISMTRDVTKNSGSPMWRCGTDRGFMVNVFKHDDPLKDSFNLFEAAEYGHVMSLMMFGETINWTTYPVEVELVANGSFWNVVSVKPRPMDAVFDTLQDDLEGDDDDDL